MNETNANRTDTTMSSMGTPVETLPAKKTARKRILFVGAPENGYFIEEYAQRNADTIIFDQEPPCPHIADQVNRILDHTAPDYIVFDVTQYYDEPNEIELSINGTCRANNSKAIILAPNYSPRSDLVLVLRESGIRYFIFSVDGRMATDEFQKCMNGYYDANEILEIKQAAEEKKEAAKKEVRTRLIGVAGCCRRIGTTTHAIQIVKYLTSKGYRTAYIQMNSTDYIKFMHSWLNFDETEEDKDIGLIRYGNVDHFYKIERIPDVLKLGYDFCVCDYGTYLDQNFNSVSFLEKDYRIFVVGSDPSELNATLRVVERTYNDDVQYIFNFASPAEEDELCDMMENLADNTYLCTQYIPDKYVLCSTEIYDKILNVKTREGTEDTAKKKRTLFERGRNSAK